MSAGFRQRTPAEYAQMAWRNKWLIVIPAIVVALATAWVVRRLPNVYESSTLLVMRPATISSNLVSRMNESDLLFRVNAIHQEVVSRSSLEPLIKSNNLYKDELARGASIESLVERMQTEDIKVRIDRTNDDMPNAFNISFRANDPQTAQRVAASLASKYVNAQLEGGRKTATNTSEFFEQRVNEAKLQLDEIDRRRLAFMQSQMGNLPNAADPLTQQLAGLYEQQKSYINDAGRLRDAISSIESRMNALSRAREQAIADISSTVTDPKTTPAYATLSSRRSQLRAELQDMLTTLTPKNPDVVAKQKQLEEIQAEMDEMFVDQKRRIADKERELRARVDPDAATSRSQLLSYQNELNRQQAALAQTNRQINEIQSRLNAVPGATVALQQMDREYNTLKTVYDDLLSKRSNANISAQAQSESQGESIQVIDSANLPQEPVAPKRPMLYAFGLALGLGVGVLLAAAREVPRLMRVQNTEDAEHYTQLPVLVALPEMLTPQEKTRLRLRRVTFATAGIALAVLSVPALIVVFRFTRLFDILGGGN